MKEKVGGLVLDCSGLMKWEFFYIKVHVPVSARKTLLIIPVYIYNVINSLNLKAVTKSCFTVSNS